MSAAGASAYKPKPKGLEPLADDLRRFVWEVCQGDSDGALVFEGKTISHIKTFVQAWTVMYVVGDSAHALERLEFAQRAWRAQR